MVYTKEKTELKKIIGSEPFWFIYLACLEKPRNMWEISKCYGFIKRQKREYTRTKKEIEIPDTRLYRKPLINSMTKCGLLKALPTSKGNKYISVINSKINKNFKGYFIEFLNKEWVKEQLFSIENIKLLYFNEIDAIRKKGDEFFNFVLGAIYEFSLEIEIERNKKDATAGLGKDLIRHLFWFTWSVINYEGYWKKAYPIFKEHKKEMIELFDKLRAMSKNKKEPTTKKL